MSLLSKPLKIAATLGLAAASLAIGARLVSEPPAAKAASAPTANSAAMPSAPMPNAGKMPDGPKPIPPSLDGIALAAADAAAVSVPSSPQAWGGPRQGNEPTLSDRVANYDISATLDPVKHTLQGQEKLTWRNRSAVPVSSVYLHLYLNAFESSGSTYYTERYTRNFAFRTDVPTKDGEWGHIQLTTVTQSGATVPWLFVHPDGGPDTDHTVVRLDLPQPVAPGESTALDIGFHEQLPRVVARTGYFGSFHLVAQWFPKIGVLELPGERGATAPRWNVHELHLHSEFYADFGNYDVKLTVPKGYAVGATGEEQGQPVEKDGQLTHHFVQGDVHDFAWTADNRTAKPLEGVYNGAGSPPVKVKVLFPPEYESNAAPVLKATIDSLKYFSETLGPYPYKTVTAVIPPFNAGEAGGMEYPTFFTADCVATVEPDTLHSYLLDFVTIHEFGHGYFYGILASNEFEEPMLDEGLNQYWDARMLRERQQSVHPLPLWARHLGMDIAASAFDIDRMGASRVEAADAVGHNSWDRLSSGSYASVYGRTSAIMHDLEQQLGKPALERAFKAYYGRWKFRHPSIADFRDSLIESTGQRALVERVFAQQVYNSDKVDDRILKFTSAEELPEPGTAQKGQTWVEETQDQLDDRIDKIRADWKKAHPAPDAKEDADKLPGPFPYRTTVMLRRTGRDVPQTLVVKFADGSSETVKWDNDSRWERYTWLKPVKAVSAELDPQGNHLLDANKLDNSFSIKADRSASSRWGSQLAALFQILAAMIANV